MHGVNLWSERDDKAVKACQKALADGDLVQALLAVERANKDTVDRVTSTLSDWSSVVHHLMDNEGVDGYHALKKILADRQGLRGNSENYYHPRNCHLSHVLRRGTGMPILLSSVWIAVGQLSGVSVEGVGLPGHFIVRVKGVQAVMVDPFADGRIITVEKCARMVRQLRNIPWHERFLDTVTQDQIVARVCRNLLVCHQHQERGQSLYRAARFAALVYPACVEHQMTYARISHALQLVPLALTAYRHVVDEFCHTTEAVAAQRALDELTRIHPRFH